MKCVKIIHRTKKTMKNTWIICLLVLSFNILTAQISDVQVKNGWITVYSNSKILSRVSKSTKEVVGVSTTFYVIEFNDWLIVLDEKSKEVSRISKSTREVIRANGNYIIVKNGNWKITYDKHWKEISRISIPYKSI